MRLLLSFTRRRSSSLSEPGRFEYGFESGAFSKRYGFIGRVNGDTASILKRSGAKLAGSRSKYGKSRTECSALLHNHNFDLWFNFSFAAFVYFAVNREPYHNNRQRCLEVLTFSSIHNEEKSQTTILDSAWENLAFELVSGHIQIQLTKRKGLRTRSP